MFVGTLVVRMLAGTAAGASVAIAMWLTPFAQNRMAETHAAVRSAQTCLGAWIVNAPFETRDDPLHLLQSCPR